jgi:glycosyltransferase involved in cell wall biosynthesis
MKTLRAPAMPSVPAEAPAPRRVAFFSNQFASDQGHGIARYSRELLRELKRTDGIEPVPVAGWSSLPPDALSALRQESGLRLTGLGRHGTSLLWTFCGTPPLERLIPGPLDAVHALSLGYPVATRKPFVVTIHDLGPLTHPEFFRNTRPWVMQRSLAQAVRQAAALVCVSQSTADEVDSLVGNGIGQRVHVVPEGVSREFFEPADRASLAGLDLPPEGVPFVLSAGAISPRKNVQGVVRAMAAVAADLPHHLVLVGGNGWDTEAVARELRERPALRGRVHLLGYVSDAALRALYAAASVYVHPSLYEGFGLTVLEAMACGTPVIAADRTSLPEVVGDAGLLVDPLDTAALADSIRAICQEAALAASLSRKGRAHAATFTWADCAGRIAAIHREL